MTARLKIKIQAMCGDDIAIGPGKADLLEAIAQTGSMSAAGRALGISYRRTWQMVDVMNRSFKQPLVASATGGAHGGGAALTPFGKTVLADFRSLEALLAKTASVSARTLLRKLA